MNKPLLYSTLAVATVAAVALSPVAAGAVANQYQGGQTSSQAIRARDGSGTATGIHTVTQDRQYVHLEDGTCDGTGAGDGTGSQQRMHGRQ